MSDKLKMSGQFMSVVMAALVKSLAEQSDITPVFAGLELSVEDGEVFVDNPPSTIQIPTAKEDLSDDSEDIV